MSQITAEYPALNGGVSQRPERQLRLNQLRAQLNMIYDPVVGLTRRPGLAALGNRALALTGTPSNYREFGLSSDLIDYSVYYSVGAGSVAVVNQTAGTVLAAPTVKAGDTLKDTILAAGISAVAAVGDLCVFAGNGVVPTFTTSYPWADPDNQRRHVVWVRGGAYSRAFRLTLVRGNTKVTVEYRTLEASYPKVLDTSDLLPTDPEYTKKVSDRTNAYNSEATAWIAAALADIAPENIAAKLAAGLEQSGFLSPGSTVEVVGSNITIDDTTVEEVEADDGGDGNLMRAVGNVVGAPELLTVVGYPGKIVKVRPGNSERGEVFYLRARAKDATQGKYTNVTWEEAGGEVVTPDPKLLYLVIENGVAYMSTDLAWINTNAARAFPLWKPSAAGDLLSNPAPEFFNEQITALDVFQDRLIVCRKDGYVSAGQPGDYFNFFRQSAVTSVATDPVAFFIIGGNGDTVRQTVVYDKNLLLIGDKRQYALPGNRALVPGQGGAVPFSAVPDMATIKPAIVAESVFFARFNNGFGSMHTMRPGRVEESPNVVDVTEAVNTLVAAAPTQVVAMATPDIAFLRGADGLLYVADYEHVEGAQRYSIHTWDFPSAGSLIGISAYKGRLRMLWLRAGTLFLEQLVFQQNARGVAPTTVSDAGREFVSRVVLVSPRFSPEAGNITGTGLGSDGFKAQMVTVNTMTVYFADSGRASLRTVNSTGSTRLSQQVRGT